MRKVIIAVLVVLILITLAAFLGPRMLRAAAPTQPIAFSHKLHAGDRAIPCMFCHTSVSKSNIANVPSEEICAGCHRVVRPDSQQVQKLMNYFNTRQPVPWQRVYRVPDFVYFSHQMHVANNVACESCHGNVSGMDRISQAQPITMGWCLECHRSRGAPTDCWTCHK
ncbi:MAG TPA: cytochrome c3 family protein [Chloroflexota bacterium]